MKQNVLIESIGDGERKASYDAMRDEVFQQCELARYYFLSRIDVLDVKCFITEGKHYQFDVEVFTPAAHAQVLEQVKDMRLIYPLSYVGVHTYVSTRQDQSQPRPRFVQTCALRQ